MHSRKTEELALRIADAQQLQHVPVAAAEAYVAHRERLISAVNAYLSAKKNLSFLLGGNIADILPMNHEHHIAFMSNVFFLNQYELLVKTMVWVYRIYHTRGFSYDYFPFELRAWIDAVERYLAPEHQEQILAIYQWMIRSHTAMISLAEQASDRPGKELLTRDGRMQRFLDALLGGDQAEALVMAHEIKDLAGFEAFLLEVRQPSMYEIGNLWEKGVVSVAQEHLASSIVGRVLLELYTAILVLASKPVRGRAVITAAPNEFHEIGAWMVSDLLELDGWQIRYLGANASQEDLLQLLDDFDPQLLALSVTMPFNLDKVKDIITEVRKKEAHRSMKIMVGGGVFLTMPDIWSELGADAAAGDAREATLVARRLCS